MGQYTDKMTQKCVKMSLFVRVVTHYGSNESNDSLGVFSVPDSVVEAKTPISLSNSWIRIGTKYGMGSKRHKPTICPSKNCWQKKGKNVPLLVNFHPK